VVERGFLMANLWWIGGESWFGDGEVLVCEYFPRFSDLFLVRGYGSAGGEGVGANGSGV
jgi:hypothetical protein